MRFPSSTLYNSTDQWSHTSVTHHMIKPPNFPRAAARPGDCCALKEAVSGHAVGPNTSRRRRLKPCAGRQRREHREAGGAPTRSFRDQTLPLTVDGNNLRPRTYPAAQYLCSDREGKVPAPLQLHVCYYLQP